MPAPGPSRCEQILDAIETALAGTHAVSTRIYRDRAEAFGRPERPAILIEPDTEIGDQGHSSCKTAWVLTVRIAIVVSGAVSSTADPIRCDVHSRLMADQTLGGLATFVRIPRGDAAVRWQPEQGDGQPGICLLTFEVGYRTPENNIAI